MKIFFVGENWLGSCARSFKEAIARRDGVNLRSLAEDDWFPVSRRLADRIRNRLLFRPRKMRYDATIVRAIRDFGPDLFLTYKGFPTQADLLQKIRRLGVPTVNVYPDWSPHTHGDAHRDAVGKYDLVISTKESHPSNWQRVYGYTNRCEFVPQGYDPHLHLVNHVSTRHAFDLVMIGTFRESYGQLLKALAPAIADLNLRVAIGGNDWHEFRNSLPKHWEFPGPVTGDAYISLLRSARICIAPLTSSTTIRGVEQPGDVDTTRTYELAAAHCFFIHRRTPYVQRLYDESEVPTFDNASELAEKIRYFLPRSEERMAMASRAHARAVPAYSIDARASEIMTLLHTLR